MGTKGTYGYVELHARSAFSFRRGASLPGQLVKRATEVGLTAIGLLDRDGFYGSPRFWMAAQESGVRAVYGCELTLEDASVLPILIQTTAGYQRVCRLLTRSKLRSPKGEGFVGWDELTEIAEGVVCLTGDEEGAVVRAILQKDFAAAEAVARRLVAIFGASCVYIEVQRHLRRGERWLGARLVELARTVGIPLVATNGVLHAHPNGRRVLDVLSCSRLHTHLDAAGEALMINAERHLKGPGEMAALFVDLPEAVTNTVRLAETLEFAFPAVGYEFPEQPPPAGLSSHAYLRQMAYEGARRRYGEKLCATVRRQLEKELRLITLLGFTGYFLLVWDIVGFCEGNGILVQGRGSAANSAVCYSLGITAVDPIGNGLLFERFLNENRSGVGGGRKAWPDIDLDLPSGERREQVIQEMYRRFGRTGCGMVANVITLRGKSAMREVGKALNLPADVLDRFSSLFHSGDFEHTLELGDQFERAGLDQTHPRAGACLEIFQAIHGLPHHLGQHSGGMVFSQHRLDGVVPLENATMPGRSVLQWDKDDCEDLGLVKVDLLGLGMMAAIQDTLTLCRDRGREIDLAKMPKDDGPTYDAMCRSDTIGVFQVESRAQMATLARMQPRCFYDVAIQVAIVRPGPIEGGLMHPFLARRDQREAETYLDERLRPILRRTLGVCMFQEQMMAVAMKLANFSGAEVDELRRALNYKRDPERLERIQEKLRRALVAQNLSDHVIEEVVKMTRSFALYGFPESHALSFALLAYASTFLKVHRTAEFTAALLNNQPMGFYAPQTLVRDAKAHGLKVRPVCVERSEWECTVEADDALRLGFNQVVGLRQEPVLELVAARRVAPWRSLADLRVRSRLTKDELRALARLGAFNSVASHRRAALWQVESNVPIQDDLFATPHDAAVAPLRTMNSFERLEADFRTQRLTTGPHPMRLLRDDLPPDVWKGDALADAPDGATVTIAGMVICRQRPGTAKGCVFVSLEDESGVSNAVLSPELFEAERLKVTQEKFLAITGIAQTRHGLPIISAIRIEGLALGALRGPASHDFH